MEQRILKIIRQKKAELAKEGFEIVGIFGSYARDEATEQSDIDIAYDIKAPFMEKYHGFEAFSRLKEIKDELKNALGKEVDLATIDQMSRTFQTYALKDLYRV